MIVSSYFALLSLTCPTTGLPAHQPVVSDHLRHQYHDRAHISSDAHPWICQRALQYSRFEAAHEIKGAQTAAEAVQHVHPESGIFPPRVPGVVFDVSYTITALSRHSLGMCANEVLPLPPMVMQKSAIGKAIYDCRLSSSYL